MKKQFVTYEIALKLKELCFNEMCIATYDENREFNLQDFEQNYETFPLHILAAPLWQQVIDWFRDKYSLYITITSQSQESWQWHIQFPHDSLDKFWEEDYTSYEEALEEAVLQALKRIENEKKDRS